ncbi:hypothetical protein [Streptomyces sp. NPDC007355]|uniref:hypothetical protein n=1 Tax=Streptomyces sp. NPDC007355 TaxID=3364778 RepID=UPI00369A1579
MDFDDPNHWDESARWNRKQAEKVREEDPTDRQTIASFEQQAEKAEEMAWKLRRGGPATTDSHISRQAARETAEMHEATRAQRQSRYMRDL